MIRPLTEKDYDTVIDIVNINWKKAYSNYINPLLLNEDGCKKRADELRYDFQSKRLSEYVWEEQGQVLALLSIGDTADTDRKGAFEIWRVYVKPEAQGHNIGSQCLAFAEQKAKKRCYQKIIIWAFQENTKAVLFYQKNGYVIDKSEYLGKPYLTVGTRLIKKVN
ncbi:GNAT family N-acetyltransferase [Parablautia intestinalis]|uniref:GNAT family N-acetyltransferase n=1 Tax=Parablautia intestinalis TaxID=2320100 RepID=A0A3A9AMU3_9FIRM|nr:GNAT family N-acetyltransferase [Parablautia intestinalis]RKI87635.1 GNAT family N-acetyltransferase [Parablautia intestinalis]